MFLGMGLIELAPLNRAWTYLAAVFGSLALMALTLQTSIDVSRRSRSAPRLVKVLGVVGGVITVVGLAAITLHVDSIVQRGIFSGYEEATLVVIWGLATIAAYGFIAVAVHRNASWFIRGK